MPRGPKVLETTKRAICSDYTLNPAPGALAKKYKLNPATISRIVRKMREAPIQPEIMRESNDWKSEALKECRNTFLLGVRDRGDIYKAASLARDGLKGLGEFQDSSGDQVFAQMTQWFVQVQAAERDSGAQGIASKVDVKSLETHDDA